MLLIQQQPFTFKPRLLIRSLALCWLIMKLLCYKLWLGNSVFPLVPVHNILLGLPNYVHVILFAAILLALAALFFFPQKKWICIIVIIAELGSCLLDQNRWEPWEYQFCFMLLAVIFLSNNEKIKLNWQLIIAGLYFFSGLGKLNHGFILLVWNNMILHQWLGLKIHNPWIYRLGYLLPLIEMTAAIALLFYRTRKIAVITLCGMHLFILILLGPAILNFNNVIWPWNILMAFMIVHLFYRNSFDHAMLRQKNPFAWFIILFWWILPWFNLTGQWDDYFSSALYSGKAQYLFICTSNKDSKRIFRKYFTYNDNPAPCDSMLSVFQWGVGETNVSPNPETRVFKEIIRQWEKKYDTASVDRFFIKSPKFSKETWVELHAEK